MGDKLFSEFETLRKKNNRSDLLMNFVFRDILDDYIESNKNEDSNFYLSKPLVYYVKTQNETEILPGIKAVIERLDQCRNMTKV